MGRFFLLIRLAISQTIKIYSDHPFWPDLFLVKISILLTVVQIMKKNERTLISEVTVVGEYPLYRLGMVNLIHSMCLGVDVREVESITELEATDVDSGLILFLSLHACVSFLEKHKAEPQPHFVVLFSPYIGRDLQDHLEAGRLSAVFPMAVSLFDAKRYLYRMMCGDSERAAWEMGRNPDVQSLFLPDLTSLTSRERQVMRYVVDGLDYDRIAVRMSITKNTVKVFIGKIYRKMGVFNRTQAACVFTSVLFSSM